MNFFQSLVKRNAARRAMEAPLQNCWVTVEDIAQVVQNPNDMFSDEDIYYIARNEVLTRDSAYFDRFDLLHEVPDRAKTEIHQELVLHLVTEGKLTLKKQRFAELVAQGDPQNEMNDWTTWLGERMVKAGLSCDNKGRGGK